VAGRQESVKENHHHQEFRQCGWRSSTAAEAGRGRQRTGEVGDGVGDGERGADALAAAGHVLAEQELREALLHHVDLWRTVPEGKNKNLL